MGSKLKSTIVYLLLLPALLLGMTACTDDEIADSIGIIAIGAGVIIICSDNDIDCSSNHRYRHRPRRHRHRDRCYYDHHGRYRCSGHHYRSSAFSPSNTSDMITYASNIEESEISIFDMGTNEIQPEDWATAFDISVSASEQVISALESAREGNSLPLKNLGLTSNDLIRFATLRLPKTRSIKVMADNLNAPATKVKAMLQSLLGTTKLEQQKAVGQISL